MQVELDAWLHYEARRLLSQVVCRSCAVSSKPASLFAEACPVLLEH